MRISDWSSDVCSSDLRTAAMTDFARYGRQVILREVGVNGQQLLRDSTVLIVGLGGLGSPAASLLAGAGVGRLLLRSEERRVGKECVSPCRYRRTREH